MKKKFKVVYIGGPEGFQATEKVLSGIADVIHSKSETEALSIEIADADALLDASMKVKLTNAMSKLALKLKIISCATTGADHIDRDDLNARNIPVLTLREDRELLYNITPAAELSWALLMACARKLVAAVEHVRTEQWTREKFPGIMLNGKRLGVIGCGRIGQWMSKYANAFGMDVVGYDPYLETFPDNIRKVSLEEMFETSDFVSVHVHLSDETRGLVNAELIAKAQQGLIIINTSRGPIIDQDDFLDALESGHLGAAGIDVLTGEPDIVDHPLVVYAKSHDNLLITPHCGGYSPDAVKIVCEHAAKKIKSKLEEVS